MARRDRLKAREQRDAEDLRDQLERVEQQRLEEFAQGLQAAQMDWAACPTYDIGHGGAVIQLTPLAPFCSQCNLPLPLVDRDEFGVHLCPFRLTAVVRRREEAETQMKVNMLTGKDGA